MATAPTIGRRLGDSLNPVLSQYGRNTAVVDATNEPGREHSS